LHVFIQIYVQNLSAVIIVVSEVQTRCSQQYLVSVTKDTQTYNGCEDIAHVDN